MLQYKPIKPKIALIKQLLPSYVIKFRNPKLFDKFP